MSDISAYAILQISGKNKSCIDNEPELLDCLKFLFSVLEIDDIIMSMPPEDKAPEAHIHLEKLLNINDQGEYFFLPFFQSQRFRWKNI